MVKIKDIRSDYIKGSNKSIIHWEDLPIDIKIIDGILEKYIVKKSNGEWLHEKYK